MRSMLVVAMVLALIAGPVAIATPASAIHHVCVTEPCHDDPQDLLCSTKWVKQVLGLLGACDEW